MKLEIMGYHRREIKKGTLGHPSKIREELEELEDAMDQEAVIMSLLEMADLYGALEALVVNYGYDMEALRKMSDLTKSAFQDGSRK